MDTSGVRGLLGLFLASGHLTCHRTPVKSSIRGTFHAGVDDRAFLEEKAQEVRLFVPTEAVISPYRTPVRDSGKRTTVLRFRLTSTALRPIYNLLYPNGEREITRPVLELLGGRAAAWLWAEGARLLPDGSSVLSHVGFLKCEARLISGWLELLTGASSSVTDQWRRPRLAFSVDDTARIRSVLHVYAPQARLPLFQLL